MILIGNNENNFEIKVLGEKARDELNDALVAGLEKLRFSKQTKIGRDFYEVTSEFREHAFLNNSNLRQTSF